MSEYGSYRSFPCGSLRVCSDHTLLRQWAGRDYAVLAEKVRLGPMRVVVTQDHPAGEDDSYGWVADGL